LEQYINYQKEYLKDPKKLTSISLDLNILMLKKWSFSLFNLRNDLSGTLPDRVQGLVKKTLEALDSSANFSFLRESTRVAFGFIHSTSSNENVVDNTPNILLRFAIGDYSQGLSMRTAFKGWFEPSVSLGLLGVDKILK
jgi:hypothetical protein